MSRPSARTIAIPRSNPHAAGTRLAASHPGLTIAGLKSIDSSAHDYRGLAAQIAKAKPDVVYFGGGLENTVRLWRELHAAMPRARLMGSGELLVSDFYRKLGGAGPRGSKSDLHPVKTNHSPYGFLLRPPRCFASNERV